MDKFNSKTSCCSYCSEPIEYIESFYICDKCKKGFCSDHHSEFNNLCRECYIEDEGINKWRQEKQIDLNLVNCHDCNEEMDQHFERTYELELGFLGSIDLCHECLNNRRFEECSYCGEIHELDDMVQTENDEMCILCSKDQNKKTVDI